MLSILHRRRNANKLNYRGINRAAGHTSVIPPLVLHARQKEYRDNFCSAARASAKDSKMPYTAEPLPVICAADAPQDRRSLQIAWISGRMFTAGGINSF